MARVRCALRQSEWYAEVLHVRWSMQRLAYTLLILGVLGTLASGLGPVPLLRLFPAFPLAVLALLATLGCLSLFLRRVQRLEQAVSQTQAHSQELQAQFQGTSRHLETMTAEVQQCTQALHDLQQA